MGIARINHIMCIDGNEYVGHVDHAGCRGSTPNPTGWDPLNPPLQRPPTCHFWFRERIVKNNSSAVIQKCRGFVARTGGIQV